MTDFLEEIEEQLRSDRYKALALKVWPWILGVAVAALVLALAWWGLQSYRSRLAAKSSETYAAALDLYRTGQIDKAYAADVRARRFPAEAETYQLVKRA